MMILGLRLGEAVAQGATTRTLRGGRSGCCIRKWVSVAPRLPCTLFCLLCLSCLKPDKFYYLLPLRVSLSLPLSLFLSVCECVFAQYKAPHANRQSANMIWFIWHSKSEPKLGICEYVVLGTYSAYLVVLYFKGFILHDLPGTVTIAINHSHNDTVNNP